MPKTQKRVMGIEAMAEVTKNVKEAFPDVAVHMSKGVPTGALLTVHWDETAQITETVLLIEAECNEG